MYTHIFSIIMIIIIYIYHIISYLPDVITIFIFIPDLFILLDFIIFIRFCHIYSILS